jgi:glycerol-3-phosphate acyltransferase PlsY
MGMGVRFFLVACAAYLIGSFPTGVVVGRLFFRRDPRKGGSGVSGATNVARQFGKAAGFFVSAADMGKGAAAVALGRLIFGAPAASQSVFDAAGLAGVLAAICAVFGHIFPIFAGFRGGKGVAAGAGALVALAPGPALVSGAAFGLCLGFTGIVSLSSLLAAFAFPASLGIGIALGLTEVSWLFGGSILLALVVLFTHRKNIKRLWAGEEKVFEKARFLRRRRVGS